MTLTTEEIIINAAKKIFVQKGYAAARMDDIAAEAGINRALLHYYFRSKEKMFEIIFDKAFVQFFSGITGILTSEKSVFEKIPAIVNHELDMLAKMPEIPLFMLGELSREPEKILSKFRMAPVSIHAALKEFDRQLVIEREAGLLKPITGFSLLINVMSLCIYPFAAKNLVQFIQNINNEDFINLATGRKQEIIDFLIAGIKA
jgi:AcrR family transcriptional regulator